MRGRQEQSLWPPQYCTGHTLVGRWMLCLLNIEIHCVLDRLHVITLTSTREERSSCCSDAPSVLWHQLHIFTVILLLNFYFISIFHLPPHHSPPMLLSLFLSLYLNITPYLAGVASRHSNRTVQSPWGLWDIVSC